MTKKRIMISLTVLFSLILVVIISLPITSRFVTNHGLVDGKLKPCEYTTNCVCSEDYPNRNTDPYQVVAGSRLRTWVNLKSAVENAGGEIKLQDNNYLRATFTSPVMRFVDDFEARLDQESDQVFLRSASRVGRNDMGANKKRIELVLQHLQELSK